MGEAKYRKAHDPDYGKVPKQRGDCGPGSQGLDRYGVPKLSENCRGLVISCPMKIDGTSLTIKSSELDRQELRVASLLWDRLVWPNSRVIYIEGGPDADYLQQSGILFRPEYTFNGDIAQGMAMMQITAFQELENREPGLWALAQGERSFMLQTEMVAHDRGTLVELHRAVPVPDQDVPLEDVLEFKHRRADDLAALRAELDQCYLLIDSAEDKALAELTQFKKVDAACADMVKLARETFPFRMASLGMQFTHGASTGGVTGWKIGDRLGLPLVGAAIGAAAGGVIKAAVAMRRDLGLHRAKFTNHPYRFVYHAHDELFQ